MTTNDIYSRFLSKLTEKVPEKSKLVNILADILIMEKESVYRRLRGDVLFTFQEAASISNRLGISIDEIGGFSVEKTKSFQLKLANHVDINEIDYLMFENFVKVVKSLQFDPSSREVHVTNMIPRPLAYRYPFIKRFQYFKWNYFNNKKFYNFEDIKMEERLITVQNEHLYYSSQVKETDFIIDPLMIQHFISDVLFFRNMNYINDESLKSIQKDLFDLLNDIEEIASRGQSLTTGNKIDIYISNVNFNECYYLLSGQSLHLSMILACIMNSFASLDRETFETVLGWAMRLKRLSTHISQTGEHQRIKFLSEQRRIVGSMIQSDFR